MVTAMGEAGKSSLVTARLAEVEAELAKHQAEVTELDDRMRGLIEAVGRVSTAVDLLDSFDEVWEAVTPEERKDLIEAIIAQPPKTQNCLSGRLSYSYLGTRICPDAIPSSHTFRRLPGNMSTYSVSSNSARQSRRSTLTLWSPVS